MQRIYSLFTALLMALLISCQTENMAIHHLIENGDYSRAEKRIQQIIAAGNITDDEKYSMEFQIERMHRIRKDFSKTAEEILEVVHQYYPNATKDDLSKWEADGSLEYKMIDGGKWYFHRAANNLFRINKEAKARKIEVDGVQPDKRDRFLESYLPGVMRERKSTNATFFAEKRMRLNYTLMVDADAVPPGEVVRCWLPFPMEKGERQKNVKLVSINNDHYILSPRKYAHRTIYSEKTAVEGKQTKFELCVEFTGVNQWHALNQEDLKPYRKDSAQYQEFTAERRPHIVFTERIKELSKKIVGDETNPLLVAKKIYHWIDKNIPWAGAREYSTIQNISDYCLSTGHGDCGIKTFTFMTLARYHGIPARWESGLMLHPGNWNLHDWGEAYFEGIGWIPIDQSFGLVNSDDEDVRWFFFGGNDAYHLIVNSDYGQPLYPAKIYPRSETVDFQRGEVEWEGGNLYFDQWSYDIDVEYLN